MSYGLNFHQTFAPEREAIAQLVRLASQNSNFLSKEEISNITSIPTGGSSGKVIPHILYSEAMGLITYQLERGKYRFSLTDLGRVIVQEDPYIIENITMWICHYNIARKSSKAQLWAYIFNSFVKITGLKAKKEVLAAGVNKHFNTEVNLTPFRSCYTADKSFSSIQILQFEGDEIRFIPHNIDPMYKYVYAYQLLKDWEDICSNDSEITIEFLINELGYGNPYLWSEKSILAVLEMLSEERIVLLNKQLNPLTIVKQASSTELLNKLYSLLI
jgi:hypothetical protein